jgi:hypothetical protein
MDATRNPVLPDDVLARLALQRLRIRGYRGCTIWAYSPAELDRIARHILDPRLNTRDVLTRLEAGPNKPSETSFYRFCVHLREVAIQIQIEVAVAAQPNYSEPDDAQSSLESAQSADERNSGIADSEA